MTRRVTYLSIDPVTEGVGRSQVLPYVERLARRGLAIDLHSFEQSTDVQSVADRLTAVGVRWHHRPFGRAGSVGGVQRVARLAAASRGAELVHARSDLPAAAAMLGRSPRLVWDMRAFWADQRIALGQLRLGSPEERVLRRVEHAAARSAGGIITLANAAIPVLTERHGADVAPRTTVIPTCVELDRFPVSNPPPRSHLRLQLSGTLNRYYDVNTALRFTDAARRLLPTTLEVLAPDATPWIDTLRAAGLEPERVRGADMPARIAAAHAGISICRFDAGISLRAAMPTKIAEYLASGRPVIVSPGIGDVDDLLRTYACGIVVPDARPESIERAASELIDLLGDSALADRCRHVAETHFDIEKGVDRLVALYDSLD